MRYFCHVPGLEHETTGLLGQTGSRSWEANDLCISQEQGGSGQEYLWLENKGYLHLDFETLEANCTVSRSLG